MENDMGFRSNFVTSYIDPDALPEWFLRKYSSTVNIGHYLSSKIGCKTNGVWVDLLTDIQKSVDWSERSLPIVLVFLHECGGITRYEIHHDKILSNEPTEWRKTDGVTHSYCNGCSDVDSSIDLF